MTKDLENMGRTWGEAKLIATTKLGGKLWWKPYASRGAKRIKSSHIRWPLVPLLHTVKRRRF